MILILGCVTGVFGENNKYVEHLPIKERIECLGQMSVEERAECLVKMDSAKMDESLDNMPLNQIIESLNEMSIEKKAEYLISEKSFEFTRELFDKLDTRIISQLFNQVGWEQFRALLSKISIEKKLKLLDEMDIEKEKKDQFIKKFEIKKYFNNTKYDLQAKILEKTNLDLRIDFLLRFTRQSRFPPGLLEPAVVLLEQMDPQSGIECLLSEDFYATSSGGHTYHLKLDCFQMMNISAKIKYLNQMSFENKIYFLEYMPDEEVCDYLSQISNIEEKVKLLLNLERSNIRIINEFNPDEITKYLNAMKKDIKILFLGQMLLEKAANYIKQISNIKEKAELISSISESKFINRAVKIIIELDLDEAVKCLNEIFFANSFLRQLPMEVVNKYLNQQLDKKDLILKHLKSFSMENKLIYLSQLAAEDISYFLIDNKLNIPIEKINSDILANCLEIMKLDEGNKILSMPKINYSNNILEKINFEKRLEFLSLLDIERLLKYFSSKMNKSRKGIEKELIINNYLYRMSETRISAILNENYYKKIIDNYFLKKFLIEYIEKIDIEDKKIEFLSLLNSFVKNEYLKSLTTEKGSEYLMKMKSSASVDCLIKLNREDRINFLSIMPLEKRRELSEFIIMENSFNSSKVAQ